MAVEIEKLESYYGEIQAQIDAEVEKGVSTALAGGRVSNGARIAELGAEREIISAAIERLRPARII